MSTREEYPEFKPFSKMSRMDLEVKQSYFSKAPLTQAFFPNSKATYLGHQVSDSQFRKSLSIYFTV